MNRYGIEDFRKIDKEIESVYNGFIRESGISLSEFWILLMFHEGIASQNEIARELFLSKQTVNSACAKLVERGLITLAPAKDDRRSRLIALTEKGRTFMETYIGTVDQAEESVWNDFLPEEQAAVVELLQKYCSLLKKYTAQ
ncbi:MarR family winged helix-turn-helix transcriptional regulator [Treponema brennaborense]|uniref:Regulatory protein MarR n=1 Tax=Treponema brennaborense (strain DSM 12168 / CIP 105900 / DD5/3) TaxID=906968 RepID=F4LNW2_TREBD|nr:MarR family transcriptional regulator [Treponema brennaborense]AEE17939.1 regulatory protein MarR [Treponema brennaborense DSM 12168]